MSAMTEFELSLLKHLQEQEEIPATVSSNAEVIERKYSGAGSFTTFIKETPSEMEKVEIISTSTFISFENAEHGGGCLVFLYKGQLNCLEVFTYSPSLSENYMNEEFSFSQPLNENVN